MGNPDGDPWLVEFMTISHLDPFSLKCYGKSIIVFCNLTMLGYHFWTKSHADGSISVQPPGLFCQDRLHQVDKACQPGDQDSFCSESSEDIPWDFSWDLSIKHGGMMGIIIQPEWICCGLWPSFWYTQTLAKWNGLKNCSLAEKNMFLIHKHWPTHGQDWGTLYMLPFFLCRKVSLHRSNTRMPIPRWSSFDTTEDMNWYVYDRYNHH